MTALPTVDLPGLERPLPRLVLGTMTFGDTVDLDTARRIVDQAVDSGITSFDTANGYAGGRSEEMLGQLLGGRRNHVTVATKAGIYPGDAGGEALLSPAGLRSSLEASLRRLRTDYVDIYYLHQPDRSVPIEVTVEALGGFVKEGTVRSIGVSNYAAWQIADIFAVCDASGTPRPVLAQQLYNLVARRLEAEYAEFAVSKGLATIVYNPLGGGLLTGRHSFTKSPTEGRFGTSALSNMYKDRYWNAETFAVIDRLSRIAAGAGLPLPELSLRWLLSKPVVSAVLLGGSKPHQLEANVAAAQAGPLPADVAAACDEAGAPLLGSMPGYNR
jgi:aryl-alcohol dehydrogenase-like predicted oxidoreductase